MRTERIERVQLMAARAAALRSALWAVALAVSLAGAAGAIAVQAQPEAADPPQAGSGPREPSQEPAPKAASEQTADDEAPEIFVPSEEISGDTVVSFPVDI